MCQWVDAVGCLLEKKHADDAGIEKAAQAVIPSKFGNKERKGIASE